MTGEISVIVPTYGNKDELMSCIVSLANQNNIKGDYEIIIVNDNSPTDKKMLLFFDNLKKKFSKLISKKRLRIINTGKNSGAAHARNKGAENSRYDIIAFIDGDCIADKNWLSEIKKSFDNKNVKCVSNYVISTDYLNFAEIPLKSGPKRFPYIKRWYFGFNEQILPTSANLVIRKSLFLKYRFDEKLRELEDKDLILRILKDKVSILRNTNMIVVHKSRIGLSAAFKRNFTYGFYESLLYKKFFYSKLTISILFSSFKEYTFRFPFTIFLRVKKSEIFLFIIFVLMFFNWLPMMIIMFIVIFYYSLLTRSLIKGINLFFSALASDLGNFFGNIAGSIKNRIIFI